MFPIMAGNSASTGYNLTRSLRFRASASAYLNRTPAAAGNQRTWTYSNWIKRGTLGVTQNLFTVGTGSGLYFYLRFLSTDVLEVFTYDATGGTYAWQLQTTQVFRDPSAWYHIVVSTDTTQATASNRVKIYVNGTQVTAFAVASYPSLNYDTRYNVNVASYINSYVSSAYFDGYTAEFNSVDGQALTPSSFGSTNALTGVWQPARYAGTYGTNGFYLPFTDNSALTTSSNVGLGKDFSGNGNYWTTNNISITAGVTYDSMTDVPTLTSATAANFAVLNPLNKATPVSITNGNLQMTATTAAWQGVWGSLGVSSAKWYFEATITANNFVSNGMSIGVALDNAPNNASPGSAANAWLYNNSNAGGTAGRKLNGATTTTYGATYTTNDVIGVAVDLGAGTLEFYKNNTSQGVAFSSGVSGTIFPYISTYGTDAIALNCGQRPFSYTPPTGFVALNAYNLPTSTILQGNKVMDATLWTGNGATRSIVNAAGFQPDLVWSKARSAAISHLAYDSVRGATKYLQVNLTSAEGTGADSLTAFNSNGFSLGADTSTTGVNQNGTTYVGWQWQAGQGSTSTNTNGSITSTVSVNASAGFSVVTYTGTGANATVGHGLGVAPSMVIVKCRNTAGENWQVYSSSLTSAAYRLRLNTTDAQDSQPTMWNSTAPTSSVFSVGTATGVNASTQTYVAYCWTPIAGYSAFGSYSANASADGPFIYTGFRPRWVLLKAITAVSGGDWVLIDTARNPYNVSINWLFPNASTAESNYVNVADILSNGFKIRATWDTINASGATYLYAAFAENPFKNSLAR